MTVLRKLMIVQWSGPLPDWTAKWIANADRVRDAGHGWDFLLDPDPDSIHRRIRGLGVTPPPLTGRKLCDYRPALGEMYANDVAAYDFWGHTDLDCVYGPLWDYVTDELLAETDVYSNDWEPRMCGPFSLYRTATASSVFRLDAGWRDIFEFPVHVAYDERGIAAALGKSGLRRTHRHFEGEDSMYVHFTSHPKTYPTDLSGWPWTAQDAVSTPPMVEAAV